VELSNTRLKELRRFEELGKSRHSEVVLVESQEAAQEAQVEVLKGQVDVARALLSFLTAKDLAQSRLVDKLERVSALEPEEVSLGRALTVPTSWRCTKLVEAQQDEVRVAKGAWSPTITAYGNYYFKRNTTLDPIAWDATIAGSVPIFQGGSQLAAVRQAKSQLSQAQYTFELGLRQARSDIHTAYVALRAVVAGAAAAERAY